MSLSSDNRTEAGSLDPAKKDQTDVEQLLALAGPRDAVPAERLERMRAAVHEAFTAESSKDAWKATPRTRARSASGERPEDKPRGWGPAELKKEDTKPRANWALIAGLRTSPRYVLQLVAAAAVAAIVIAVLRTPPVASPATPAEAPVTAAAAHISTGPAERKSLLLRGGGELRVDASSAVTIAERGEIHISKGAVYLDSKGTTLPPVITPAGRITDIGTRFEVRLVAGNTRVRVRDGKVRLAPAMMTSAVLEVAAGEELLARADATSRRHVNPFGAEWAWVARAAPRFELEGKSLGSFLDWIEKEGGWTVAFASPALERSARSTVLHGSVEDMSTTEALETILLSCGLVHRVDLKTGRVTVAAEAR